jgi:hypothetical protein
MMARIVVVTHEFDIFAYRRGGPDAPRQSQYMLFDVLQHLEARGHDYRLTRGPKALPGDLAILHVDLTVVPDEYLELGREYSRTLNFRATDISKRAISPIVVGPGDDWPGPVIVKSNLNCNGMGEEMHNLRAREAGRSRPHPALGKTPPHLLLDRLAEVDDAVWANPSLVVEKFLPETDADGGYIFRTWVFMGSHERCTRFVGPNWIGKASEAVRYEPMEVPANLRAERDRLGFDYGKFDFVMHEGQAVLLDANRTPGTARSVEALTKGGSANLAQGLREIIEAR